MWTQFFEILLLSWAAPGVRLEIRFSQNENKTKQNRLKQADQHKITKLKAQKKIKLEKQM